MKRFVLLFALIGCGGSEDDTDVPDEVLGPCEGSGDPSVQVGLGTLSDFVPFADTIAVASDPTGVPAVQLSLLTTGLDTREPVTTVTRLSVDGDPTNDPIALLQLQCTDAEGWAGAWAPLDASRHDAAIAGELDGLPFTLSVTLTDAHGAVASTSLDLELENTAF